MQHWTCGFRSGEFTYQKLLKCKTFSTIWKQESYCVYEKEKKNIQAANRREEERQAGCHTSKTGTQLQQTAEITEHEGKRNTRCERRMYPEIETG